MGKYTSWSSTELCNGTSSISNLPNDLSNGIKSICKIFADDTRFVQKLAKGKTFSNTQINSDLNKIRK